VAVNLARRFTYHVTDCNGILL